MQHAAFPVPFVGHTGLPLNLMKPDPAPHILFPTVQFCVIRRRDFAQHVLQQSWQLGVCKWHRNAGPPLPVPRAARCRHCAVIARHGSLLPIAACSLLHSQLPSLTELVAKVPHGLLPWTALAPQDWACLHKSFLHQLMQHLLGEALARQAGALGSLPHFICTAENAGLTAGAMQRAQGTQSVQACRDKNKGQQRVTGRKTGKLGSGGAAGRHLQ